MVVVCKSHTLSSQCTHSVMLFTCTPFLLSLSSSLYPLRYIHYTHCAHNPHVSRCIHCAHCAHALLCSLDVVQTGLGFNGVVSMLNGLCALPLSLVYAGYVDRLCVRVPVCVEGGVGGDSMTRLSFRFVCVAQSFVLPNQTR